MADIPIPDNESFLKLPRNIIERSNAKQVIVILQQATLETVKTKKGFELLNCDDHIGLHKKLKLDSAKSRPDITHQLLLTLLDSPLNKAGLLHVYIETNKGILIDINSSTRIPRTFKRFCGLFVQLLHKMRVKAVDSTETLMKVIKNPVTQHLPLNVPIIGLEANAPVVDAYDLPSILFKEFQASQASNKAEGSNAHQNTSSSSNSATGKKRSREDVENIGTNGQVYNGPVVFVIGAMSHDNIRTDYVTHTYSLSKYPLSAACAASKLVNAFEHAWNVL
jgi:rRNA small subunit pseudouridine methyltransferase Nep1